MEAQASDSLIILCNFSSFLHFFFAPSGQFYPLMVLNLSLTYTRVHHFYSMKTKIYRKALQEVEKDVFPESRSVRIA